MSPFISYALSPVGQQSVLAQGFIPVKMESDEGTVQGDGKDNEADNGEEAVGR